MSALSAWLADRRPLAPREPAGRLRVLAADGAGADATEPVARARALTGLGLDALGAARRRPGRVRETAYDLLLADALLTYACEAALDAADPDDLLEALVGAVAASER